MKLIDKTFESESWAGQLTVEIGENHGAAESFSMDSHQGVIGDHGNRWQNTRMAVWLDPIFIQVSHSKKLND